MNINIAKALGDLLVLIAKVATTIRMNSSYCNASLDNPDASRCVMHLSDMLHNLNGLGLALGEGDWKKSELEIDHQINYWLINSDDIRNAQARTPSPELIDWTVEDAVLILRSLRKEMLKLQLFK